MDRYQCLELFYGHGASVATPHHGGIIGVSDTPHDAPQ